MCIFVCRVSKLDRFEAPVDHAGLIRRHMHGSCALHVNVMELTNVIMWITSCMAASVRAYWGHSERRARNMRERERARGMEEIGPTSVVSSYYYYYYKKNKRCQDSETPTRITMPAPCAMAFRSGPGPAVTARSAARGDPLHTPTWPPDLACRACRTRVKLKPRAPHGPCCMHICHRAWSAGTARDRPTGTDPIRDQLNVVLAAGGACSCHALLAESPSPVEPVHPASLTSVSEAAGTRRSTVHLICSLRLRAVRWHFHAENNAPAKPCATPRPLAWLHFWCTAHAWLSMVSSGEVKKLLLLLPSSFDPEVTGQTPNRPHITTCKKVSRLRLSCAPLSVATSIGWSACLADRFIVPISSSNPGD